jgi:hypothetical protein
MEQLLLRLWERGVLTLAVLASRCLWYEVLTSETRSGASYRGLLRRMTISGGLQHCTGKEVSRFDQGKGDFIENIDDDVCIHYDGGRVAANESLIAEISARGLRKNDKRDGP